MEQMTTEKWRQELGENLKAIRLRRNTTRKDVAAMANISIGALAKLESGRCVSLDTFIRTVRALGREGWLLDLKPEEIMTYAEAKRMDKPPRRRAGRSRNAPS